MRPGRNTFPNEALADIITEALRTKYSAEINSLQILSLQIRTLLNRIPAHSISDPAERIYHREKSSQIFAETAGKKKEIHQSTILEMQAFSTSCL